VLHAVGYAVTVGTACYAVTVGTACYAVTMGTACYAVAVGTSCYAVTVGTACYAVTVDTGCTNMNNSCTLSTQCAGFFLHDSRNNIQIFLLMFPVLFDGITT